jgi:hypothetical protein
MGSVIERRADLKGEDEIVLAGATATAPASSTPEVL